MTTDATLSVFGIVVGISICAVVIRVTRDGARCLAGRLDLASAWAKTQQYVSASVFAMYKQMIIRSYDYRISENRAAMIQRRSEQDSRADNGGDDMKSFGIRGSHAGSHTNMVARSVVEGDPSVEDQSDDDEGKMQITVRMLESRLK